MAQVGRYFLLPLCCAVFLAAAPVAAHTARAVLDPGGSRASFLGLARITCFDDGTGTPSQLYVRVRDNSPPVAGLLVTLQVLKGTQALGISDTQSGDALFSEALQLPGGAGVYTVLVGKTAAGARQFDIDYHCLTATGDHTGTDIVVDQFK